MLVPIVVKGALKVHLGPRHNHSLIIGPCLPRHAPCLRGATALLFLSRV